MHRNLEAKHPHIQRLSAAQRTIVTRLAATGGPSDALGAVQQAAAEAAAKLTDVARTTDANAAVDAILAADDALVAFYDACGGLVDSPTALPPATTSRTFSTQHGAITLSANAINECLRAGAKPEVLAERMAAQEHVRKPRVAP